jgi:DNA polymerase III psi subunit
MKTAEKTKLPPALLSSLYRNVLIASQAIVGEDVSAEKVSLPSKRLVALVASKQDILPEKELVFLANIMNACKLKNEEYAALPVQESDPKHYLNIKAKYDSPLLLLFGLAPASIELPIHFPAFQPQSFQGIQYLAAPRLDEIENDKALKLQLWQCLKQILP